MITVNILINGQAIYARSARNQDGETNKEGQTKYITDAGVEIWHDTNKGAVELAKKMLDTIELDKL